MAGHGAVKLRPKTSSAAASQDSTGASGPPPRFAQAKASFDELYRNAAEVHAIVPVRGQPGGTVAVRDVRGNPNEEYYKWQFIYSLIHSGLYAKDYIGAEVHFPKGNKQALPLKLDAAIFDSGDWLSHYNQFWATRHSADLEWLNEHLLCVIEFKKNDSEMERVFTGQVKPAMREKEPSTAYVLGIYYAAERLFIFHRRSGLYLRYDEAKNQKGDDSKIGDLALHLPDPYT
jgi:type I restriction enzyme M protein